MRYSWLISFLVCLSICVPLLQSQDDSSGAWFSEEQLENLVAPIALYPDPLLAQLLLAATFPDQLDEAARFLRTNTDPGYIDSELWDVSVKSVAHYPTVLYMMADKLDWTTSLGQAYVNQSTDVMTAVQRLRAQARSAGNLVTTPEQEIVESDGYIQIWPARPQFIYVPVYDPEIVYFRRPGFFGRTVISFGAGFAIGVWLNHDFDWRDHRVFYTGWDQGGGWVRRSRPYVRVTNVYVNNSYRNIVVNRTVIQRPVNYGTLNRYNTVHRQVDFGNVRRDRRAADNPRVVNDVRVNNKIIQRNIDTSDRRINVYRGHEPEQNRPQVNATPAVRPPVNRPDHPAPPQRIERRENPAFGGSRDDFGARAASQRGQASRTQVQQRPAPTPKPSSAPQPRERSDKSRDDRGRRR